MLQEPKPRKLDTQIIVALIGAGAVLLVAIIALVPYFFPKSSAGISAITATTDNATPVSASVHMLAPTPVMAETNTPTPASEKAPTPAAANIPATAPGGSSCFDRLVDQIPPQIVTAGRTFQDLQYPPDLDPSPVVIVVTDKGIARGAIHVTVDTLGKVTYVEHAYDAHCQPIETFYNSDNPQGDKLILEDNATIHVTFSEIPYELTFQVFPGWLRVSNIKRAQ